MPDARNYRVTLDTMPAQRRSRRDNTPAEDETPGDDKTPAEDKTPADDETMTDDETIAAIESALHSLARRLGQSRLKDYIARQAGDDVDQAGMAVLYVLHEEQDSLRITDLAARLGIDSPAVTRKAQQLERLGLVSRGRDTDDARACLLQLTPEGRQVLRRFLLARHQWLTTLLADWPPAECREFARLICRFTGDIDQHLGELNR
jgi:DNA-binding MarR family transcriptional regulator